MDKVRTVFPTTYVTGTLFWPVVNVLNFRFCPPAYRILYVNLAGLFWNTILR